MSELPFSGAVAETLVDLGRLNLGPGDVLVVRTKVALSIAACARLKDQLAKVWPDNEIVIVSGDLDLGVISQAPAGAKDRRIIADLWELVMRCLFAVMTTIPIDDRLLSILELDYCRFRDNQVPAWAGQEEDPDLEIGS